MALAGRIRWDLARRATSRACAPGDCNIEGELSRKVRVCPSPLTRVMQVYQSLLGQLLVPGRNC
jgi:hypothetical protein